MSRPRYVVQTVTGFSSLGLGARFNPGISAHVCDTLYLYEVVASYRSEYRRDGHARAVREAEAHAERLNRDAA